MMVHTIARSGLLQICNYEFCVSILPGTFKLLLDQARGIRLFLGLKRFEQTKKRTTVSLVSVEISSEYLFCFRLASTSQQHPTK
jgi:hypothetical protein